MKEITVEFIADNIVQYSGSVEASDEMKIAAGFKKKGRGRPPSKIKPEIKKPVSAGKGRGRGRGRRPDYFIQ